MDNVGVFAEAFGYTPAEYRALSMGDRQRLVKYLSDKRKPGR